MALLPVVILAIGGIGGVVIVNRAQAARKTTPPPPPPPPPRRQLPGDHHLNGDATFPGDPPRPRTPEEIAADARATERRTREEVAWARISTGEFTTSDWFNAGMPSVEKMVERAVGKANADRILAELGLKGFDAARSLPFLGVIFQVVDTLGGMGAFDARRAIEEALEEAKRRGIDVRTMIPGAWQRVREELWDAREQQVEDTAAYLARMHAEAAARTTAERLAEEAELAELARLQAEHVAVRFAELGWEVPTPAPAPTPTPAPDPVFTIPPGAPTAAEWAAAEERLRKAFGGSW